MVEAVGHLLLCALAISTQASTDNMPPQVGKKHKLKVDVLVQQYKIFIFFLSCNQVTYGMFLLSWFLCILAELDGWSGWLGQPKSSGTPHSCQSQLLAVLATNVSICCHTRRLFFNPPQCNLCTNPHLFALSPTSYASQTSAESYTIDFKCFLRHSMANVGIDCKCIVEYH